MEMLCKGWMPNVFSQPLVMLRGTFAPRRFWISLLQFFKDTRGKSLVNDVIRIRADDLWSINRHALPLPSLKAKHFPVELIREPLRPSSQLLSEIGVQDCLQGELIANLLIASCLVNKTDDPDVSKSACEHFCFLRGVKLPFRCKSFRFAGFQPSIADIH